MNIHELAAQAIKNQDFYKKHYAPMECLAQAVDRMTDDCVNETFILKTLAPIYLALGPKSRSAKKNPTGLARYALFAADKDTRFYLNYIHVTQTHIVASDGCTLLVGPNDENLEPGYYCPKHLVRLHEPDFAKYPSLERVLNTSVTATINPNIPDRVKVKIEDKKNVELVFYKEQIFNRLYIARAEHALHGLPDTADLFSDGLLIKKDDLIAIVVHRRSE